ncbi:MAG: hypothetical protein M3520_01420 [Actinomycetota bacterium]|nr:hypothetical protein [Actinomycetota bacterium]
MRRVLVTALAVPVLLLSACGGDDDPEVVEPGTSDTTSEEPAETTTDDAAETTDDAQETTEEPAETTTEEPAETTTEEPAETTTDDAAETTEEPDEPTDDAAGTTGGGEGEATGEEQAAADRTKQWLVAFVNGDDEVCDYMLDLTSEGPMTESQSDMDICVNLIPSLAGDMFDAEMAGIIESMEINGATIEGDTAVVGRDNFSEMFGEGIGDQEITLKLIDGEWYVDLQNSFQP